MLHGQGVVPHVNSPIGDALAADARQGASGSAAIVNAVRNTVAIAELKLGEAAMQVLLAAMLIHALHAVLEDGECSLDRVRVDSAIGRVDVLADAVKGRAMLGKRLAAAVHTGLVGHQAGFATDAGAHDRVDLIDAVLAIRHKPPNQNGTNRLTASR